MPKKKAKKTKVAKKKEKVGKIACGSYETWWVKPSHKEDKEKKVDLPERITPQDSCWRFE